MNRTRWLWCRRSTIHTLRICFQTKTRLMQPKFLPPFSWTLCEHFTVYEMLTLNPRQQPPSPVGRDDFRVFRCTRSLIKTGEWQFGKVTIHGLGSRAPCIRMGGMKDNFVFGHIFHFSHQWGRLPKHINLTGGHGRP